MIDGEGKTLDKCIKISSGLDISPNRHHEGSDIQVDSSLPIQFGVCWSLLLCHSYSNSLIQFSLHQVLFQWRILGIQKAQSLVLVRLSVGNDKRINVQILVCKVTYWVGWWSQQNFGCLIYINSAKELGFKFSIPHWVQKIDHDGRDSLAHNCHDMQISDQSSFISCLEW